MLVCWDTTYMAQAGAQTIRSGFRASTAMVSDLTEHLNRHFKSSRAYNTQDVNVKATCVTF